MELKLTRYYKTKDATDGILTLHGKRICCTAEHTPTCLKPGKYRIQQAPYEVSAAKKVEWPTPRTQEEAEIINLAKKRAVEHANDPTEDVEYVPAVVKEMACLYSIRGKLTLGCIRDGNGVYQLSDASIIIGEHQALGLCILTDKTFRRFFSRLRKSWKRREPTTLIIEDCAIEGA